LRMGLAVNTQTPLLRFRRGLKEGAIDLGRLVKGVDYYFAPGGVTAMVYPMVRELLSTGELERVLWVSLNPGAPPEVSFEGLKLYHVDLPPELISRYASFKEGLWREIHGLGGVEASLDDYKAYVEYNWRCAKLMLDLLDKVDLLWIHDFQQLRVGGFIGPAAPTVFRWHVPFKAEVLSHGTRRLLLRSFEDYSAVVVSTRRDMEGLMRAGFRGLAYQIYPYIDQGKWRRPSGREVAKVSGKYGLREDDEVVLLVARMDYVKRHDLAIKSHALLRRRRPRAVLLLVGDGSFTSSALGHSKGERWRSYLVELARELKVEDSVRFLGYVDDDELRALYARANVVLLPSMVEGFGLTVVEAWALKRPVVVSRGAGVSELVIEGVNGYTHRPEDYEELCMKVEALLSSGERAERMGELGYETSKQCWVSMARERVKEVFEEVARGARGSQSRGLCASSGSP